MHQINWIPSGLVVHREVFKTVGRFREGLHFAEDMDLCFRIASHWPDMGYCPRPLFVYSVGRPGSLTTHEVTVSQIYILCDVYDRHLKSVGRCGQMACLVAVIAGKIRRLSVEMFIIGRGDVIRHLLGRYVRILPVRTRTVMMLLVLLSLGGFGPVRDHRIGQIHVKGVFFVRKILRKLLGCS